MISSFDPFDPGVRGVIKNYVDVFHNCKHIQISADDKLILISYKKSPRIF